MELSTQYLIIFAALAVAIFLERAGNIGWAVTVFFGTGLVVAFAFN